MNINRLYIYLQAFADILLLTWIALFSCKHVFYQAWLKFKTRCALKYFASCFSLTGIHTFSSYLYDTILITCHCLSNGWVIIPHIWQMMEEGLEEIFRLLWLSEALHIMFQDKEYVIIYLPPVLIPYPSEEFSWLHLWKPKSLSVQKVDSLMQGKVKKQVVVYAVHWKKNDLVLVSCDTQKTELGILNDGNKGVRRIQELFRYK